MANPSAKADLYADRIRTILVPARLAVEQQLAKAEYERAEYADLAKRLKRLGEKDGAAESTMMELGAGVWVDAVMPNTSKIVLDLGFDIHVEMPTGEAAVYAQKRVEMLEKRCGLMQQKRSNIDWQIEQFQGAIAEASAA